MPGLALQLDTRSLLRSVAQFSGVANTTTEAAWLRALRGLARRVVGITPPANSDSPRGRGGSITSADRARGDRAIERDLHHIFTPVTSGGIGAKGQDPAPIHRRIFIANKKPGKLLRSDLPAGQFYFADERALAQLEVRLKRKVGRLAGQWNSGVEALGIRSPAWVARHGSADGDHRLVLGFLTYAFVMSATDVPDSVRGELIRRIGYAISYTENSMEREIEAILLKAADRAGFSTSR